MVDRTSRNQLSDVIRSYMDDQITAFDLDDNLEAIRAATNDKTVRTVVRELWLYYDDHYVVASKKEWDDFNRLLLLLASDAEITGTKVRRIWHSSQLVAAVSLASHLCLSCRSTRMGARSGRFGLSFRRSQHGAFLVQQATNAAGRCHSRCCVESVPEFQNLAVRPAPGSGFREDQIPERDCPQTDPRSDRSSGSLGDMDSSVVDALAGNSLSSDAAGAAIRIRNRSS